MHRSPSSPGPLHPRNVALAVVACAYVGVGSLAFHLTQALVDDADTANAIVAALALPLGALLWSAARWIEEHL